jgi:short-subunit dehydrogenase
VALIARTEDRLRDLEAELPGSKGYRCDVADPKQVKGVLDAIESDLGSPSVLIHNAVGGAFGSFLEIDPEVLNRNFQVNTMALLYLARRLAPAMVQAGRGTILVTGNTSAQRGMPRFAGFAPTKAAQRILAEAMARELGPKGVHARALQGQARRLLHQADRHRGRTLARRASGSQRLVLQCRGPAICREVVVD